MTSGDARRLSAPVQLLAGVLTLTTAYLLLLEAAAAVGRRKGPPSPNGAAGTTRFLVLVPAHDEEAVIGDTLESLRRVDYPQGLHRVVVIADNCSDETAGIARGYGADVLERRDVARGKGLALAWALNELEAMREEMDAVVFVDADCVVSPNLLASFDARLRTSAAVQADNVVANPEASTAAALRFAAFSLRNTVRPLGLSTLGLSCGLLGTGMAFRDRTLQEVPWESSSLIEDFEQHMRLVAAGERVAFAPEARVASPMPASLRGSVDQQLRWEGGRSALIRRWTPELLASGVARRDLRRLHAALEPLIPPQSLLLAGSLAVGAVAARRRSRAGLLLAGANLTGQATFVVGGLALVGAPARVYRALLSAPPLVAFKLWLYLRLLTGRGPTGWAKTSRGA